MDNLNKDLDPFEALDLVSEYMGNIFNHVGFIPSWSMFPIDDVSGYYWRIDDSKIQYADSPDKINSNEDDYYEDYIFTHHHYKKSIYEGEKMTMVFCDPQIDAIRWFKFFDNSKRIG